MALYVKVVEAVDELVDEETEDEGGEDEKGVGRYIPNVYPSSFQFRFSLGGE